MRLKQVYKFLGSGGPFFYGDIFSGLSNETVGAALYHDICSEGCCANQQTARYLSVPLNSPFSLEVYNRQLSHTNWSLYTRLTTVFSNHSTRVMLKYAFSLTGNKTAARAIVKACRAALAVATPGDDKHKNKPELRLLIKKACHTWLYNQAMEQIKNRKTPRSCPASTRSNLFTNKKKPQ